MTTLVAMLLDCLMERCERNAEIQTLRLDNCYYISSNDVKRLEEIVVNVIWDGVDQEILEEDSEEQRDNYDYNDDFPGGLW